MVRTRIAAMLIASSIVALAPPSIGATQSPYPKGMDYGIGGYLEQRPAACLNAPIRGGDYEKKTVYVLDFGARNTAELQREFNVFEKLADLGVVTRIPPDSGPQREYRIIDLKAYDGRGYFCYGRELLTKIVRIGSPHPYGPYCIRYARVLTEFKDIPDWMGRPEFAPYVKSRATSTEKDIELRKRLDGSWMASTPYDPIHSTFANLGEPINPCQRQRYGSSVFRNPAT
jgi:hypothetical protein